MSQFDPLPGPDEELPLEHEPTLLDEHDAELNYANAVLWVSLTKATPSQESAKDYVIQGEKRCADIIRARSQKLKTALLHLSECSSKRRNG
ncbi:hypothetical protein GALL_89870 [mine drainage metagenome]|uniref:Uncharacterized protein n=1 Tax=mine drainage metagenome TaxID=410659 RepID=A0A1J5SY67_9ZZZZ